MRQRGQQHHKQRREVVRNAQRCHDRTRPKIGTIIGHTKMLKKKFECSKLIDDFILMSVPLYVGLEAPKQNNKIQRIETNKKTIDIKYTK